MNTRQKIGFLGRVLNRASSHGKAEYNFAVLLMGWQGDKAVVMLHDTQTGDLGDEVLVSVASENLLKVEFGGKADPILVSPIPKAVFAILYA